jgi:chromatin remodeling complex protein RSC6
MASLESIQSSLLSLEKSIKALQRETHKIRQKLDDPTGEKAKARSENNSFKKPQQVSDQLRAFLKLADGEMISRSEVTKRIFAYAKENSLNNGKVINLDATLKDLLKPLEGQDVTVTNLQKYINHHYTSSAAAIAAAAAVASGSAAATKTGTATKGSTKPKVVGSKA